MRNIRIKKNQTLFDVSLQEYGDVEGVFFLVADNEGLIGITDTLHEGDTLMVREEVINAQMRDYLSSHDVATAEGARGDGIGYMTIGVDFEVF